MTEKRRLRNGPLVLIAICVVLALVVFNRIRLLEVMDPLPTVRIGTATDGGTYAKIGKALKRVLEKELDGSEVRALYTNGSIDNIERLIKGSLELALIQSDVDKNKHVQILSSLYKEYLHIIVRTDRLPNATSIKDLEGKRVALGPKGSGSRIAVLKVLDFLNVKVNEKAYDTVARERDALIKGEIDAIGRVAGLPDQIVTDLLMRGGMALLPVTRDGPIDGGFIRKNPGYSIGNIEGGTYDYSEDQASPEVSTIFVTALLVARSDLSINWVRRIIKVLDENLVELRSNHDIERYLPDSLGTNVNRNPYHFKYHPGTKAYYRKSVIWYWIIPNLDFAGYLLLVIGLGIALREGCHFWRLCRIPHYLDENGFNKDFSHDVFLCYSTAGQKVDVDRISNILEENGLRCWYAPRDIPGGKEWPELIPPAIKQTEVALVLLFTEHANDSEHIARELTLASSMKLKIIPYFLENTLPKGSVEYHIANVQWIEAYDHPYDKSVVLLMKALNEVREENIVAALVPPGEASSKASVIEPHPKVSAARLPDTTVPPLQFKRRRPWIIGMSILFLFSFTLVVWFSNREMTAKKGMVPVLSSPVNNTKYIGGLSYKWKFASDKLGIKYELQRSSGGKVLTSKNILGSSFREKELSGAITWKVRALVPDDSNGDLTVTAWSDSRTVERYKDTLDKIRKTKQIVVAVVQELKRKEETDPELKLIRNTLEEYMGESIQMIIETMPFNKLGTLFTGKDIHKFDIMAAYISVRESREQEWGVRFTDPFITYPQAFVFLKDTDICVEKGQRPCKIAVIEGTVNEDLAHKLIQGNSLGKVVPIGAADTGYYKMYDMLFESKADLLLVDKPFALQFRQQTLEAGKFLDIKTVDEVMENPPEWEKIALATKIKDVAFRKILNRAIKRRNKETSDVNK